MRQAPLRRGKSKGQPGRPSMRTGARTGVDIALVTRNLGWRWMHEHFGMSCAEIAAATGWSRQAVADGIAATRGKQV